MSTATQQQHRTALQSGQTPSVHYPLNAPECGLWQSVAAGIYWLRMPMKMGLDHINVYLLDDEDGWYVIDTGLATEQVKQLWHELIEQKFDNKPLKGLICTHFHYDHASLAQWFIEHYDVEVYMSAGEYYLLRTLAGNLSERAEQHLPPFYRQHGVPEPEISALCAVVTQDPFGALYPHRFTRLQQDDVLHIGGRQWQVWIGAGHSPEHVCLYCPEDALFIAGDQLLPTISSSVMATEMEPNADPLGQWLTSLEQLSELPAATWVLPAHGEVFIGAAQRAQQLIDHHQQRLIELEQTLAQQPDPSLTLYQICQLMFRQALAKQRSKAQGALHLMLAIGETSAHINYLVHRQRLIATRCPQTPLVTYQLAAMERR